MTSKRKAAVLAGLLLSLPLLVALLHTRPVEERVGRALVNAVRQRVEGAFDVGTLSYRLWRGELTLRDVRFEPASGSSLSLLGVRELRVRWQPLQRVSVRALAPVVVVQSPNDAPVEEAGTTLEPSLPHWLAAAEIEDGELRYRGGDGVERLVLGPWNGTLASGPSGGVEGSIEVKGGFVAWDSRKLELERIAAEASGGGGDLEVERVEIRTDAGTASGDGTIDKLRPFEARFRVDFRLDAARLTRLADVGGSPLAGEVQGSARLRLDEDGIRSDGGIDAPSLSVGELGSFATTASWSLGDDRFEASLRARRDGARLTASVDADLEREAQEFAVELDGSSLVELVRDASSVSLPWDAGVRADLSARTKHWSADTLEGSGTLALSGKDAELEGLVSVEAAPGRIVLATDGLSFPGGRAQARAELRRFEDLTARYDIDVVHLERTLRSFLPRARLEGELEVKGEARGKLGGALANELRVDGRSLSFGDGPFTLAAKLSMDGEQARLETLSLEGEEGGSLEIRGSLGIESRELRLDGRLHALPLRGFAELAGIPLKGLASGTLEARGALPRPSASSTLELTELSWHEVGLPALLARIDVVDGVLDADVRDPSSESRVLAASAGIEAPYPLEAEIDLSALPWPALTGAPLEITGRALARGPIQDPSKLVVDAEVSGVTVRFDERTLVTSPFTAKIENERLAISDLALVDGARRLAVDGVVALRGEAQGALEIEGEAALDLLELAYPEWDAGGTVQVELSLAGPLHSPALHGELVVEEGRLAKGERALENLRARLSARGTHLEIESMEAELLGGDVVARGTVPLRDGASGKDERVELDASGIDFGRLASAEAATSLSFEGVVVFTGGSFDSIEASGRIQEILMATEGAVVALAAPAEWRLSKSGLEIDEVEIEGNGTDVKLRVRALAGEGEGVEPLRVSARGDVDLGLVGSFLPESMFLSGAASLEAEATYSSEDLELSGTAHVRDGELTLERPPLAVTDVSARLRFEGERVHVEELSAQAGGGSLAGTGGLSLPGLEPELRLEAENVRLEYPEGLRSEVSASLRLVSPDEGRSRLEGTVVVEESLYDRDLFVERELLGALRRETLQLVGAPGWEERFGLDVEVETARDVVVDNNLGRMRVSADVHVGGTLAAPEMTGTLRAEPGGELTVAGNTYEVENARVALDSYPVSPPSVEVRARTRAAGRDIVLTLSGKTDNLRSSLESPSDPTLSRADLAALLLTGRTLEEARGEEGEVLGEQAVQYFGSSLSSLTERGLSDALPLSTVRLEPTLVGQETDPGVRFSVGQAVTEDLFLTYSIGLDDAEKQLWIVDQELPFRLKLRAVRDDANEYTGSVSQDVLFDLYDRSRPKRPAEERAPAIEEVTLEGEIPVPADEAFEALGLEPGDDYDYWSARSSATRLSARLREEGFLTARVLPSTSPGTTVAGEPVRLAFEVEPGPRVELVFSGEALEDDLKDFVQEGFDGYLPPRARALRLGRALRFRLMSRGHYTATVETNVEESEGSVRIEYVVSRGPLGEGVRFELEGNRAVPDETLLKLIPDPSSPELFELLFGRPDDLKEDLELLYSSRGYLESEVEGLETRSDANTSELVVSVRIAEGDRFRVGTISLEGNEGLSEDELRSELRLPEGEGFLFSELFADRARLASRYRDSGFPDVSIESRLERSGTDVDVTFEIDEGEKLTVGNLRIEGATVTRREVIEEEVTFGTGDPLRLSDFIETQGKLYDLHVFQSVDVRVDPRDEEGPRDVVIEVAEVPDVRIDYGIRYDTEDQLELTGNVELPNLLGSARRLGLTALANDRQKIFRGNFGMPSFFGLDLDTTLFVSREAEDTDDFRSRAWSATFQQGRPVVSGLRAQWSLGYRRSAVTETVSSGPFGFDVRAQRTLLSFSLIEDTRNRLTRPTSGRFWNATLQYAPAFLGSDLRFVKLFGQLFLFRRVASDVVWASSYRAGVGNAFDQVLLPEDRFRAGGPSSVRGFPVNELGPVDPLTGTVLGGEGLLVVNQELRFPLFWRLGGLGFYDAGNVYLQASDFDPLDLRHSLGAGLSVELPVGLVTLHWARVLNPPPGLERSRFHFRFGYAF